MSIPHALPGQPVDVRALGPSLEQAHSTALFKSVDLEVMHLVLPKDRSLPPHRVAGEITIHCLEGRLEIELDGRRQLLAAGQLLYLPGGALHGVRALQSASALLHIALRHGGQGDR